jgi:hypothetical protein
MNRDDIIKMAREAGLGFLFEDHLLVCGELERFAAIVANRCAEIAYEAEPFHSADLIRKEFNCEKR